MTKKFEYDTILIKGPQLGVFAEFPFDSSKEFGSRRTIRVKVSFDGKIFSISLLPHGNGKHWLHLKKEIRDAIGKTEGDAVHIILEEDTSPPEIGIPEYLAWLLENEPVMMKAFEKVPLSAKKFWMQFIEEPKNEDTKVERVNRFFDFLKEHYVRKVFQKDKKTGNGS